MKISRKSSDNNPPTQDPVAIVGMSLRVPGANTLEQFWRNLVDGKDCLSRLSRAELEQKGISPSELSDPSVISAKPEIQEVEYFDADFFGFSSTQAELSDPAHRLFLQCAWEAMEHAGIAPGDSEESTGVFAGVEGNYLKSNLKYIEINNPATGIALRIGNSIDYVNLRVSHELNLVGPSYTTMATCSTSLAAVHLAVQSLQSGECDTAIAGGSKLELPNNGIYRSGVDGMLSASGTIRPFDARGDGTIFGSGVGVVVLKPLETAIRDGNPIYSVILGSAFCNDGKPEDKKSFIAPTPSGQQRAIARALERAKIDPRTIGMVECHGTGTLLGDPTEVTSLTNVYRQSTHDRSYCALGSVKANVGHLGSAAGVVSLIKSCMAINKGIIPPLANFEQPNPEINFSASPFYINTEIVPWNNDNHPRRAGVSAFGFGGANAHLILGEYQQDSVTKITQPVSQHLFVVSAKNPQALQRIKQNLAQYLEEYPDILLSNIAHTLQMGRQAMSHRDYLIASDNHRPSLIKNLRGIDSRATPCSSGRRLVFLYPGQGSQVPGMGQSLYAREAVFRDTIDYCSDLLMDEIGFDLRKKMFIQENASLEAAQESLRQTAVSQPALFVVEYALSKLYAHWGAEPDIMLGHSLGELVAACLAGVFSIDDGLRMVAIRSRMMQACQPGSMLAVLLPLEKLVDLLPSELDLAAENGPSSNVVSGDTATVQAFSSELESRGISNRLLATSHAFHSRMMDENFDEYCQELEKFNFHPPQTCIISNVTGQPMTNEQALNPRYWAEQRRNPVKFSKALVQILSEGIRFFLRLVPARFFPDWLNNTMPKSKRSQLCLKTAISSSTVRINSLLLPASKTLNWKRWEKSGALVRI